MIIPDINEKEVKILAEGLIRLAFALGLPMPRPTVYECMRDLAQGTIERTLSNLKDVQEDKIQEEREEADARQRRVITQVRDAFDNHGKASVEEVELLELRKNNDTLTSVIKALVKIYGGES